VTGTTSPATSPCTHHPALRTTPQREKPGGSEQRIRFSITTRLRASQDPHAFSIHLEEKARNGSTNEGHLRLGVAAKDKDKDKDKPPWNEHYGTTQAGLI